MPLLIEAQDLARRFGATEAVAGVSFAIGPGTVVGFLGPNGAGKSTTMRLLAGYLQPDRGSARVAGYDIVRDAEAARTALGYLPEAASGFSTLTVREFLTFAAEARGLWGSRRRRALDWATEAVDLAPALDRVIGTLSKGWRQRAWLAQAILHDPPVLVLDEPTDGLDPNQKTHLHRFIRSVATDKAILMATHNLEEAQAICGRLIIMGQGRIVADAPCGELLDGDGRLGPAFERLTTTALS